MSDHSSEEKSEKGTRQKLRKERERGRALSAADTVTAVVVAAVLLAICGLINQTASDFTLLFDAALRAGGKPDVARLREVWTIFGNVVASTALILLGLASCMGVLATVVIKRGFVFSTENITPNFDRLNPATNLQNMFAKRALIEFALAVLRCVAWAAAVAVLMMGYAPALMAAFSLDVPTALRLFVLILGSFLVLALFFMALTTGIDLPVQRYLFEQDMMMSRSEVQREQKDQHGDPELSLQRRKQARAALTNPTGLAKTSFVAIGEQGAVGIHYVHGQTRVPSLTLRAARSGSAALTNRARSMGIPVVRNDDLVRLLATGLDVGESLEGAEVVQPFTDAFVASLPG